MSYEFTPTEVERITSLLSRRSHNWGDDGECWAWTGATSRGGYGHAKVNKRDVHLHRASYEIFNGRIPDKLSVLHRCDNPACVNPAHLFAGTQAVNIQDAANKGRLRHGVCIGENHHRTRLTEKDVVSIRERYADGALQRELGEEFGLTQVGISKIVSGRTWRHVS